jgi:UDP-glucose 4-epimerase
MPSNGPVAGSFAGRPVVVTGGAGFIGSHLVEMLVGLGADVLTVVDSLSTGSLSNLREVDSEITIERLDLVHDDLRPTLESTQFDTLFHLAGNANVNRSVEDPRMDLENNLLCTFRVLEAIRDASPDTQIVFTSSATVYGEGPGVPIREDHPKIPESPYGVSKLACEHYLRLFARLYGLKTATVRLFSVYGPRLRKQVVYDFMCKLRENPDELFIYGDGTQVRDMNHVANVVEALLLISRRAAMEGEVYNVASGEPVTILELAHGLCAAMGLRPEFAFSGEVRPGETQKWVPDPKKLFDLGYRNRVSLAEGLADTASWFLEEEPRSIRD